MLSVKLMQKLYALYYQQLKTPTCLQYEGLCCCQSARQRQQKVWVGRRWRGSTVVQNVWRTPIIIYGIICLTCACTKHMMLVLCIPWHQGGHPLAKHMSISKRYF
jgi:hypothetical protein